jgi:predicted lipoprotein
MTSAGRAATTAILIIGALTVLQPWTIRPIETARPRAFDAVAYVDDAWPRLVQEAVRTAADVLTALPAPATASTSAAPPTRRSIFVKATGVVTEVDRRSRVGVARVRIGDARSGTTVGIQIGPVLRGTALRDAASFVRFTDFGNQSEFAALSNAFNDRVLRQVLTPLEHQWAVGRTVTVLGAVSLGDDSHSTAIDITPVQLQINGGDR